ncbi:MAG: hypothetical protein HYX39_03310 [Bacteroidetes bacterium]|nr:hypothetical protein [Bacteroidota bacterium]
MNKTYNYVIQWTDKLSKLDASTIYSYNAFLNDYNTIYLPNVSKDFTATTESMVTFNRLTVVEKQILDIYWHAVRQLKSLETFENFTILFENVLISSNFDSTSKSKLLSTLSVARYSQAYWNNN